MGSEVGVGGEVGVGCELRIKGRFDAVKIVAVRAGFATAPASVGCGASDGVRS